MATVEDFCKCPRCKGEARYELNTRTYIESTWCEHCGTSSRQFPDEPAEIEGGYGTRKILTRNGIGHWSFFRCRRPLKRMVRDINRLGRRNPKVVQIEVTRRIRGRWVRKVLFERVSSEILERRNRIKTYLWRFGNQSEMSSQNIPF